MTEEVSKSIDDIVKEQDELLIVKLEKIQADANNCLGMKEDDPLELQIIKCISAASRFNDILLREKHTYNKMKAKYERMYAEMIDVAKQNPLMYRTNNEIDGFIIRDVKVARAKTILQNQLEIVEYLQSTLDLLKAKRFDLKTLVELKKTENGR